MTKLKFRKLGCLIPIICIIGGLIFVLGRHITLVYMYKPYIVSQGKTPDCYYDKQGIINKINFEEKSVKGKKTYGIVYLENGDYGYITKYTRIYNSGKIIKYKDLKNNLNELKVKQKITMRVHTLKKGLIEISEINIQK